MADETGLSLLDRARISADRQRQREEDARGAVQRFEEIRQAETKASEERRGHLLDTGAGVLRAAPGAFEETFDLLAEMDEWALNRFGSLDLNPFDNTGQGVYRSPAELREAEATTSEFRVPERGWREIKNLIPEPERFSGQTTEALGKFLVGFMTGKKALQAAGWAAGTGRASKLAHAAASGAAADLTVFDGHEERLSNLIQSAPALRNPVTEYLAADEDDSELEGRLKSVLEGMGLGLAIDGLMTGFRALRANRKAKAAAKAEQEADEIELELPSAPKADDSTPTPGKAEDGTPTSKSTEEGQVDAPEGREAPDEVLRDSISLSPQQAAAFRQAVASGDEAAASASLKDFNENTFDWASIESGEDIKRIFSVTERVFADTIDTVKGGVQSNKQTKILANLVGHNYDSQADAVSALFRDVRGDKGIAARFYAAQRINLASAQELFRLGKIAKESQAPADEAAFLRQMQIHAALQAEVKGAQTEIARALQAMSVLKHEAAEGWREFENLKKTFGNRATRAWMDRILGSKNLNELNANVRQTKWERAKNIFIEYTINSMLSSVKTHIINFTSNTLNTFVYTGDRALGGLWRRVTAGDKAALREARVDLVGKFSSLSEALKLAKQAWKDGAPVSDVRQRVEFQTRKAIAMDGEGWLPKTVNMLGSVVRTPGRALITADEFFKTVNRNSEMKVLAFRQADEEATRKGLEYGTDAYERAVEKRMKALLDPDNKKTAKDRREIEAKAVDKSRLVTFQESARTDFGRTTERWVNANSFVKLIIAPFFRTPMNILRQGLFDRTPLGLTMRETRRALREGHPRERAEIMARMTTGVAAMAAFYGLVGENDEGAIEVVGKIPWDSSRKNAGVRDYSIRIGDRWYQFNRLEPMGMWLGMMADLKTHGGSSNEEGVTAGAQAALFAFMTNVTNKTWMKSLSELQDLMEQGTTGKTATAERAFARFASGEFGKLVPQLFKSTGRALESVATGEDPTAREAWTVMDGLSAQLPVLNKDLPPRHDVLGRKVQYEGGWKEIANPFAQSGRDPNVIDEELWKLNFTMRPMNKSIGAGKLELNAEEYSELTGLVNETGLEDILKTMIESPGWESMRDGQKIALIKKQVTGARQRARTIFLSRKGRLKRFTQAQVNAKLFIEGEQL